MCVGGGGSELFLYMLIQEKQLWGENVGGGGGQAPLSLMLRARLNPKKTDIVRPLYMLQIQRVVINILIKGTGSLVKLKTRIHLLIHFFKPKFRMAKTDLTLIF